MNMLDQPDNVCSLLSKANREPDYNVKTKTLTGYEGLGLPMSGCCTTDSPHPRWASIKLDGLGRRESFSGRLASSGS